MKKLLLWGFALLPVIVVVFIGYLAWPFYADFTAVKEEEKLVQTEAFYLEFRDWALAELLEVENGSSSLISGPMYFEEQPGFLINAGCSYTHADSNSITAEFGGGFYHYGLELKKENGTYTLVFYRDEHAPIVLLAPSRAEIGELVNASSAAELSENPLRD